MSGPEDPERTLPWTGQQPNQGQAPGSETPWWQRSVHPPSQDHPYQQSAASYSQPAAPYQQPTQPPQYAPPPQYPAEDPFGPPRTGYPPAPQYGQPSQFSQQSAHAAPSLIPGGQKRSKGSVALIGGLGALAAAIVVVLVLGFWAPGFFTSTSLDVTAAQDGVRQILMDETNGYGAKDVTDVKCNNGENPEVEKGATFDCEVAMDGAKRQVTVTITGDDGTYEVGRPK